MKAADIDSSSVGWRVVFVVCLVALPLTCQAYSVLTHEEIIDLLWDQQFKPALLQRFPHATPAELKDAHAYAYGGSVIQDIGYYPFGDAEVSNFTHYVRTGDFIRAMLDDAQTLNEYAFALGALSHYVSDINGHPFINLSVGIEYPKLARWYGPEVPYDVDHKAHLRTEFGFDVLQVAKRRYASEDYHNFIGFQVAPELLERAFLDTYGLNLRKVMPHEQLAINTYRRTISQLLPEMTKVALLVKGDELKREIPNFNRRHFLFHLSRADYRRRWGAGYKEPGPGAHFLAFLFKLLPKVGPLHAIDFQEPTPKTENLYFESVNQTIDQFGRALRRLRSNDLQLPDIDLDTGKPTQLGEYPLADYTYRELLDALAGDNFAHLSDDLRQNILQFYDGFGFPKPGTRLDDCSEQRWHQTWSELTQLRAYSLLDPFDQPQPATSPQPATQAQAKQAATCM